MRSRVALVASIVAIAGCASFPPDPGLTNVLPDCTEERGGWAGKPATELTSTERGDILNSASQWAAQHEYLPCNVTVCGAVIDLTPTTVSVFITGYQDINPSAEVKLSRRSHRLLKSTFYHSGCPGGVWGPSKGGT